MRAGRAGGACGRGVCGRVTECSLGALVLDDGEQHQARDELFHQRLLEPLEEGQLAQHRQVDLQLHLQFKMAWEAARHAIEIDAFGHLRGAVGARADGERRARGRWVGGANVQCCKHRRPRR